MPQLDACVFASCGTNGPGDWDIGLLLDSSHDRPMDGVRVPQATHSALPRWAALS